MGIKSYFSFCVLCVYSLNISADINDYKYPFSTPSFSNYGTLGLINMPNARFYDAGTLAFSLKKMNPYTRGSLVAYPFNWLEATYAYTDISNVLYSDNFNFSGNQSYKDKGFSTKLKLVTETYNFPAIALGMRDIGGTGIFSSEFLVASKKFYNIDITLGAAWGTMSNKRYSNPLTRVSTRFKSRTGVTGRGGEFSVDDYFSGNASIFGGAEVFLPFIKGMRLKLEYDSTDYLEEGVLPEPQKHKVNIGLLFPVNNRLQLSLGFIRGNTINFGFSVNGIFSKNGTQIKKNDFYEPVKNSAILKKVNAKNNRYFYLSTLQAMNDRKTPMQSAAIDHKNKTVSIKYSQNKYVSYVQATGRVARVLNDTAPDSIERFLITNANADMSLNTIEINRDKFNRYDPIPYDDVTLPTDMIRGASIDSLKYEFTPGSDLPKHITSFAPLFRSQIGGPDGFFFGDLRFGLVSEILLKRNLTISAKASVGVYSTFNDIKVGSYSLLPPVRTEVVEYLSASEDFSIDILQINYYKQLKKNIYAKSTIGYLEPMFGGFGQEVLYRPFDKTWAIGAETWLAKKRDYNQRFGFQEYQTFTGFINGYYYSKNLGVQVHAKAGRFLAKDSGIKIDLSKIFTSGLRMGIFATITDISKEEFGEGSFDKGFYFFVPIESFFGAYSKGYTGFGLRPITRDGGADLNTQYSLWNVTDQGSRYRIAENWADLYD